MTFREQHSAPGALEREAHGWVTRLVSGEATAADARALKAWRSQSLAHDQAFTAAAQRWKNFGAVGRTLLAQGRAPEWSPPQPVLSRRAALGGMGAIAAGAAAYGIVKPPLGLWPSLVELSADYRTATGEQRQVGLSDDVSVRLNTQTSISILSSEAGTDLVKLISGEAAFAATSPKPLVVLAGEGRMTAGRARFDVRNVGASVCVTCFDGDVRVEQGSQTAIIGSRQQLRYDLSGLKAAVAIDPAEAAAWQAGMLIFRFTPLSDVIAEINRYRRGKVILTNAALGTNPVNGRFRIQRIDEVLVWIEQAFGATARSLPGGIVLIG
jgi:transmembrane sensor